MNKQDFLGRLKEIITRAETEEKYIDYIVDDVVELLDDYEEGGEY